jgi:hypothetical protein
MRLIGLSGAARAGKDTAGGFIQVWGDRQGFSVEKHSFAAKLKISAARALGFPGDDAACIAFCDELKSGMYIDVMRRDREGLDEREVRLPGRQFLQLYGTEAHRGVFGSDFWVEALLAPLDARVREFSDPSIVVITDARFPNEAEAIRARGGEIWEVVREDNPDALTGGLEAHVSEVGLPETLIDRTIVNDGDLAALEREVGIACVEVL